MNPWKNIPYFRQSSSATETFPDLLAAFPEDRENVKTSYEMAHKHLFETFFQGSRAITDRTIVSESAMSERQLPEFCLARLVELDEEQVRGASAMERIINEVNQSDIDDWEDVRFSRSVPNNPSIPSTSILHTIASVVSQALSKILQGIWAFLQGLSALLQGLWAFLRAIWPSAFSLYRTNAFVRLTVNSLLGLLCWHVGITYGPKFLRSQIQRMYNNIWSEIVDMIPGKSLISGATRLSKIVLVDSIWPNTRYQLGRAVESSQRLPAEVHWAVLNWTAAILGSWHNFSIQSTPVRPNGISTAMPLNIGILNAANSTIYMSEISLNFSLAPQLLLQSRKKMIGTVGVVRASKLQQKDKLAKEYMKLLHNLEKLSELAASHDIELDYLIEHFTDFLADVLTATQTINTLPDPQYSFLETSCAIGWVAAQTWLSSLRSFAVFSVCSAANFFSIVTSSCAAKLDQLETGSFCVLWLSYTPGLGSYVADIRVDRLRAVRKLKQFLVILDNKMGRLLDEAIDGKSTCQETEKIFMKIDALHKLNINDVTRELEELKIQERNHPWKSWLDFSSSSEHAQLVEKKYLRLQTDMSHLADIQEPQKSAFTYFSTLKEILSTWKSDIQRIVVEFNMFEDSSGKEDWHEVWGTGARWARLRDDIQDLRPLLELLREADDRRRRHKPETEDFLSGEKTIYGKVI